jgi:serine/threonine protein kinase
MNSERLKQVEEIYHAAVEISPEKRESFFKEFCGADENLRREVESLLSFENTPANFLDTPPESLAAEMFAERENKTSLIDKEIGHYRIKRLLGRGGMGEIYLAQDLNLNRQVALKFLSASTFDDKNQLRRFKQEAFAASALNHPNILTVYEFNTDGEVCFLATEYIEGETLREILCRGKMALNETLEIAGQIAFALSAAHKAGIVHRDIKPENIMIRSDGFAKILDFGLAKLTETQENEKPTEDFEEQTHKLALTKPGTFIGTTAYMSPEQVRGRTDIDGRTDIWSLGIVFFEMLTGRAPFTGETVSDIIALILKTDPPHLSKFIDDCPLELERMINKALAKNVEERYQAIQDLALDIKSLRRNLEFETELERTNPPNELAISGSKSSFAVTGDGSEKSLSAVTQKIIVTAAGSISNQTTIRDSHQFLKSRNFALFAMIVSVLLIGGIGSIPVWKSIGYGTSMQTATNLPAAFDPTMTKPNLSLNYSLTVQSYNDGRYKKPFKLAGEMLFGNKDRVRMNVKSSQNGYLYILNESPKNEQGESSFNILFPSPTTNDGAARLSANQEVQIPQQSWFELDDKEGTELVWLIWSENAVAELESAKRFANPSDRGKIKDAALTKFIASFVQKHQLNRGDVAREDDKKESQITTNADILAHIIKLEHH